LSLQRTHLCRITGFVPPLYASAYAGFTGRKQVRRLTYGDELGQSGWLTVDELERFAEWLQLGAGSRVLDVGCGSGGPALRLGETVGASVLGVDLLEEGIATATQLAQERGLDDRASFIGFITRERQVGGARRLASRGRALSPQLRTVKPASFARAKWTRVPTHGPAHVPVLYPASWRGRGVTGR
jgi:SAM-dependent methyltransferase